MHHRTLIAIIVVTTTILVLPYQYSCNESSSIDALTRLPSHRLDSKSSPRDQAYYHHYRRSDHHASTGEPYQAALNSIPKSDKYQGWKPIISSRSLPSRYASNQKLRQSNESYARNSNSVVMESRTTEKPTERPSPPKTPPPQPAKDKIIKEDAIMWMHYGQAGDRWSSSTETNVVSGETELKIGSKNQYHSQYTLGADVDQSARENPKNIYEIMDKNGGSNSAPTFKPIADTSRWQGNFDKIPSTEATHSSWLDLHSVIYNRPDIERQATVENESHENGIYDSGDNEQIVKIDRSHLSSLADGIEKSPLNEQPTHHTRTVTERNVVQGQSNKEAANEKGGKYLGKPIVIAEQPEPFPYFTAEYYRKLFDSFDRYDRSLDEPSLQSETFAAVSANQSDSNRTTASATPASGASCGSDHRTAACKTNAARNENDQPTLRKSHHKHHFNVFKFMGVDIGEFMPKTLRTNIYAIKKLLVECYTELQDQHPSPVACLKKITTKILDKAVDSQVIKLTDNVSLVKENDTSLVQYESSRSGSTNTEWLPNIIEKMTRLFSTHSLRVQLVNSQDGGKHQVEGRRLHHYRRVFPVIVGAYMILYSILIPLSFKFLLLLGGKTLLVSKLALFLAMMGSLKKHIGYGDDYHTHPPHSHYPHSYHHESYYPPAPHYHRKSGTTKRKDHLIISKKIHHR